ncbi:hypothetical protein NL676_004301 [Syzygium grande]|nr:hypothetical protein NL676_004301 [Syzygium grande]
MCYARDVYGRSPLHIAVVKGRVDVLKELVRDSPHPALGDHEFVNLKNDDGDTIFHLAAASKQTEAMSFLMSCTAVEVNSRNADDLTAHELLARSGKSGRTEIARALSRSGIGGSPEIVRALSGSGMAPMTMGIGSGGASGRVQINRRG